MASTDTGEELHQRVVDHLKMLEARQNVTKAPVKGKKTTQGGKPIQLAKCPACPNVLAMSGHDPGEIDCPMCGTRLQFTPTE